MKSIYSIGGSIVVALALSACGGGGGSSSSLCTFLGGGASAGQLVGSEANVGAAVDFNLSTFANVSAASGQFNAGGEIRFEDGGYAGVFLTPVSNIQANEITVSTYLDGVLVQSATGPALDITNAPSGLDASQYVGFRASGAFDAIEFLWNGNGAFEFYEFCGDAEL